MGKPASDEILATPTYFPPERIFMTEKNLTPPDAKVYRQTVGMFATGVTVILTGAGDHVRGMTANSVTSLSLDPLLILFCVDKKAHFAAALEHETYFSINILHSRQDDVSNYFAGIWKEAAPPAFEFEPWHNSVRLKDSLASIGCKIDQIVEGGDHWIVIGRVLALHRPDNGDAPNPLIYFSGRYRSLIEK
jgi:flavin reductase (DIM6/NTAB) family NADH-FMN oxidoreductase RutF